MKLYDHSTPSKWISYLDTNNLYGNQSGQSGQFFNIFLKMSLDG